MRNEHFLKYAIEYFNRTWKVFLVLLGVSLFAAGFNSTSHPMFISKAFISISQSDSSPLQALSARASGLNLNMYQAANARYLQVLNTNTIYDNLAQELLTQPKISQIRLDVQSAKITFFNYLILTKLKEKFVTTEKPEIKSTEMIVSQLASDLRSIIKISGRGANTIEITARTGNKETSKYIVNQLLDIALREIQNHDASELTAARTFLENQVDSVNKRISQLEGKIVNFKKKMKSYSLKQIQDEKGNESINLQRELVDYKIKIEHNNRVLKKLKSQLAKQARLPAEGSEFSISQKSKYSVENQILRIQKENELFMTRLESLRPLALRYAKRQQQVPEDEQTLRNLSKKLELEYSYFSELKRNLLQMEMQNMSFQNKINKIERATGAQTSKFLSPLVQAGMAIIMALVLGGMLTFIQETISPHVLNLKDLDPLEISYLGAITEFNQLDFKKLFSLKKRDTEGVAEFEIDHSHFQAVSFRYLRNRIFYKKNYKNKKKNGELIAIASPESGEGKTFVSYNLAKSMAKADKKVLLVDFDFRKYSLTGGLNLSESLGISNIFSKEPNKNDYEKYISKISDNLDLLTVGTDNERMLDHIPISKFRSVMSALKADYDYILLDTPALIPVADTLEIAPLLDQIIITVVPGRTHLDAVYTAVDRLKHATKCPIGFIFNRTSFNSKGGYGYYYYKKKSSDDDPGLTEVA